MPYAYRASLCLMPYASCQAQLRSSESDISKLKSVIKVASDAVRKAAEEKAHFLFAIFLLFVLKKKFALFLHFFFTQGSRGEGLFVLRLLRCVGL